MTDDETAIRETCTSWANAVESLDFDAMRELWDLDYEHLVYQPEEFERPWHTGAEIVAYWDNVPNVVESVPEWREIDTDVALLGDAALVYSRLSTSIKIKDVDRPFDGELRCSLGLRRTSDGWRLIHYHESRLVAVEDVIAALTT